MDITDHKETRPAGTVHVYSIGHSRHSIETFLDLLRRHEIAVLVDVRSQPHSRWVPQFNRERLVRELDAAGIRYVYMGDSLGGRPADPSLYAAGEKLPDYERMKGSAAFRRGIEQLLALAGAERVAMMCAEGDYHKCHRGMLITPALLGAGACVHHIEPDGSVTDAEAEPDQLTLL